jgi:Tfp pilus assembly protein PilZ
MAASRSDKRRWPRQARRIPCEIWIRGTRYSGIVKDVSRTGLFVQTRAKATAGTAITLVIAAGDGRTEIRVSGRIVRREQIQALLATQSAAGIGIEVAQPGALGRLLGDPRLAEDSPDAML